MILVFKIQKFHRRGAADSRRSKRERREEGFFCFGGEKAAEAKASLSGTITL